MKVNDTQIELDQGLSMKVVKSDLWKMTSLINIILVFFLPDNSAV